MIPKSLPSFPTPSSLCNPSPPVSTSYLFNSYPRFLPFHPAAHRPRRVPPSSPWPGLAFGGGRRERRKRGWEVLLPVRSLVQQPADGPAALRGQETPQERSQSTPPGAASGQSGCHGEHRSATWLRARHKRQVKGSMGCYDFVRWKTIRGRSHSRSVAVRVDFWNVPMPFNVVYISQILYWGKPHQLFTGKISTITPLM